MKIIVKRFLYEIAYLLYKGKILKNKIQVMSIDETIDSMVNTEKSLVRFGDAELSIIEGRTTQFQQFDTSLAKRLSDILRYQNDKIIVGIPDIFDSLDVYTKHSRKFWKEHLFYSRKTYEKYCDPKKYYANAFLSRLYYVYEDKIQSGQWFARVKEIWNNKNVVIVEGEITHTGVENDLLDNANQIERILCPSLNAFLAYEQIKEACLQMEKDKLFLLSVGNTAKLLVCDLVEAGYRAIDIGNLDMEYDWYLQKAKGKDHLVKHDIRGKESNLQAGYDKYWSEIVKIITDEETERLNEGI